MTVVVVPSAADFCCIKITTIGRHHEGADSPHLNKATENKQPAMKQHTSLSLSPLPRPPPHCRFIPGFVKILSALSAEDRSSINSESILLPDKGGPTLMPVASLVYDDAPWLSSRLRNLRLVHPDVGDEVRRCD